MDKNNKFLFDDEAKKKWAYYSTYSKIFNLNLTNGITLNSIIESQKINENEMHIIDKMLMNCTDDLAHLHIFREMNGLNDGNAKTLSELGHKYHLSRKTISDAHNEVLYSARDYANSHVKINAENAENLKTVLGSYKVKVKRI